ncbi:MAG TPA: DUF4136 domain-containing protein, partial [Halioglobus sp.]
MRHLNYPVFLGMCVTLLLAACGATPTKPTATTEWDHSYDFGHVHKIAIQPITKDTVATMMISDEQIRRIDQALVAELQRRGFQVVTVNAEADMFLSWQLVTRESADVSTADPVKQKITQGTLSVNMIDPVMLQSVWRATFESKLHIQLEPD